MNSQTKDDKYNGGIKMNKKCKHEWQVVRENPYCPISTK